MRVVQSKIQILGWVVLSYQDDHKIRVPNTGANRFLVEGMKWNGMESDSLYQHLQIDSNGGLYHLSHDMEPSRSFYEKLWLKSNKKQNTIQIQHFHTNNF